MSSYNYYREYQSKSNNPGGRMFGLINQGSTCYLNSVLQVLFRTRGFRDAVNRGKTHDSAYIDPELKALFEDLSRRTAETVQVTNKLGIDRVNQQRDAAEYFEKILTLCSEEASQVFQGKLTNSTVCKECEDTIDEEAEFMSLPLALVKSHKKFYNVVDGLQEFFKVSHLDEDNQLYCDKCSQKSDASTKCFITRHPEVLMLLLKRFEFNYSCMSYVKNDRVVDVPHTINIPENQTYEIYAFVEHFGSLRGGHYTATIKKEDRWFCFNDSSVSYLRDQPFQEHKSLKSQSAYLLFYKRKTHAAGGGFPDNRGVLHDANRNPAHCVENNHDEEGELEIVRTDTRSNETSRRLESGLSVEAGQNREVHPNKPSHGYQDNQHVKTEGEDRKSCNTAGNDQEEKRKRRKVDVSHVNAEKPDATTASGNLQPIRKHSPEKPERESAKQNNDEKMETTEKTKSQTKDPVENQSMRGKKENPQPVNDPSRKSLAKKQKTEGNEDQNEMIESSPHAHTEPETQSQEKDQKETKFQKFKNLFRSQRKTSKKRKEGEVSERVEEKSETGNRSSSNNVENNSAAEKTKKQKKKYKPEQIPEPTNEIKTRGEVSENKPKKTTSCFCNKRKKTN
uniref:USP domain-containing protein n=1 Tax=Oryzias melastigma TaxID=30732 RepID=A0A3B3C5X8_ORYME